MFVDDSCPWLTPTNFDDVLECKDGTHCNGEMMGWSCCNNHGGRAKCPANSPTMCGRPFCAAGGSDYCCYTEDGCKDYGGTRPCVEPGRSLYTNNCKDLCLILTLWLYTLISIYHLILFQPFKLAKTFLMIVKNRKASVSCLAKAAQYQVIIFQNN